MVDWWKGKQAPRYGASPWVSAKWWPGEGSENPGFWRTFLHLLAPAKEYRTYPTTAGWLMVLLSVSIGAAAYSTANNILFLALSLLLGCLVLNGILSVLNFKKVRWRLVAPEGLHAGHGGTLGLEVGNDKKWVPTYALTFSVRVEPGKLRDSLRLEGRLNPSASTRLTWSLRFSRRGRYVASTEGLSSTFPFGFLRKRVGISVSHPVLVWPKPFPCDVTGSSPAGRRMSGLEQNRSGQGSDLRQLRQYKPGDAMHHIYWKALAKTGDLIVRENTDDAVKGFVLWIETSSSLWQSEDSFERMCGAALFLAEDLHQKGELRGWAMDGSAVNPVRGRMDLAVLNDRLALIEPGDFPHVQSVDYRVPRIRFQPSSSHGIRAYVS